MRRRNVLGEAPSAFKLEASGRRMLKTMQLVHNHVLGFLSLKRGRSTSIAALVLNIKAVQGREPKKERKNGRRGSLFQEAGQSFWVIKALWRVCLLATN